MAERLWNSCIKSLPVNATSKEHLRLFIHRMPKTDLHTHINGSISINLLRHFSSLLFGPEHANTTVFAVATDELHKQEEKFDMAGRKHEVLSPVSPLEYVKNDKYCIENTNSSADGVAHASQLPKTSKDRFHFGFGIFDAIYTVMNNLDFTRVAVQDILLHYASENTAYLELRTSLRPNMFRTFAEHKASVAPSHEYNDGGTRSDAIKGGETQESYLQTVQETIAALQAGAMVAVEPPFHLLLPGDPSWGDNLRAMKKLYSGTCVERFFLSDSDGDVWFSKAVPSINLMTVRLIVSINRASPLPVSENTIKIAHKFAERDMAMYLEENLNKNDPASLDKRGPKFSNYPYIVGIDVSGHAYKGKFAEIIELLRIARREFRFPVTLHAGEKEDDDDELDQMIAFAPERWGHLVFVSAPHKAQIKALPRMVLELCLTSNLVTNGHVSVEQHHIDEWLTLPENINEIEGADSDKPHSPISHPQVTINTDDRGFMGTSVTNEYLLLSRNTKVFTPEKFGKIGTPEYNKKVAKTLYRICRDSLRAAFVPPCYNKECERGDFFIDLEKKFDVITSLNTT